jgi:mitochondrial import inner membrane translocase subunit TIM50
LGIFDSYSKPIRDKLLDDLPLNVPKRPTLVVNLEDFLIHRFYTPANGWKTQKRPHLETFLTELSPYYEIVIFSDSYMMSTTSIVEKLDNGDNISACIFKESALYKGGEYIKDLSRLNRDLSKVIIFDHNHQSVKYQKENSILTAPWKGDTTDTLLKDIVPVLQEMAKNKEDLRKQLVEYHENKDYEKSKNARKMIEIYQNKKLEESKNTKNNGLGFYIPYFSKN